MDKLAESRPWLTPMHFGGNNPISFNDPTGLMQVSMIIPEGIGGGTDLGTVTVVGTRPRRGHPADLGTVTVSGTIPSSPSAGSISFRSPGSINYGNNGGNVITYHRGGVGSEGGSASQPDGWITDGSGYKYVDDKTVGINNIEFIDPATGQTMHGDENGNLVAVPQELMDVVVRKTAQSNGDSWLKTTADVFSAAGIGGTAKTKIIDFAVRDYAGLSRQSFNQLSNYSKTASEVRALSVTGAKYLKLSKNIGVLGNAVGIFSAGYQVYDNPTAGNATRLAVQGATIGAAFIPVVGWGISLGIGIADLIWGDDFYNWIDKH